MKKYVLFFTLAGVLFLSCSKRNATESEIETIENSLSYPVQVKNAPRFFSLEERMDHYKIPGVSLAVVKDGELRWTKGYGIANTETGTAVTPETLFQAGSISKPLAALAVLKLAEEGRIDLDGDVNQYLKAWTIPQSNFTRTEKVTVRRLLNHTAGLTVSGFPGYPQKEEIPSAVTILRGEGNTPAVVNDTIPGSRWHYSGGGYTILQKMVEDVSGMPFEDFMEQHILQPMGMESSTYKQPLPREMHSRASGAYDTTGKLIDGYWHNYPEKAAAGLWTTPTDLARYELQIQQIMKGEPGILTKEFVEKMLTKHQFEWGLGPQLRKEGDSLLFQHGGKNAGFTNMFIAAAEKDFGLVVMTNGDNGRLLMQEIVTAISEYYDWGITKTTEIEALALSDKELEQYIGRYIPKGSEKPAATLKVMDGNLFLVKTDSPTVARLIAVDSLHFIDPRTENEYLFEKAENEEVSSFLLNEEIEYLKAK